MLSVATASSLPCDQAYTRGERFSSARPLNSSWRLERRLREIPHVCAQPANHTSSPDLPLSMTVFASPRIDISVAWEVPLRGAEAFSVRVALPAETPYGDRLPVLSWPMNRSSILAFALPNHSGDRHDWDQPRRT